MYCSLLLFISYVSNIFVKYLILFFSNKALLAVDTLSLLFYNILRRKAYEYIEFYTPVNFMAAKIRR